MKYRIIKDIGNIYHIERKLFIVGWCLVHDKSMYCQTLYFNSVPSAENYIKQMHQATCDEKNGKNIVKEFEI